MDGTSGAPSGEMVGVDVIFHAASQPEQERIPVGEADPPVVSASRVTKVFGDTVTAVEDASFDVHRGEFVSLVGPSGCGKSTLLRLVAGLIERTEGLLCVDGTEVTGPRASTGLMFQKPTLLPWKTSLENALLPAALRGEGSLDAWERAYGLLHLVGLDGFEHAYPRQLSGGMQQRVALARLMMTGAELLLLDEPFGALDEFTREHLNLELLRIHDEFAHTTMFVTHNIAEAVFLADRVIAMTPRPGRIAEIVDVPFGRPREIGITRSSAFTDLVFDVRRLLGEPG